MEAFTSTARQSIEFANRCSERQLRLLVLCHEYPPIGGGAAAVCHALNKHYSCRGHDVRVLTMGYGKLPQHESTDGIAINRVSCNRRRKDMASPWEGLIWSRKCLKKAASLHRTRPFDAIHAHFVMPGGIVATRISGRFGVPVLITIHGSDIPGYNQERLKLAHAIVRPWWRQICRRVDQIVSPSQSLLNLLRSHTFDALGSVVPNGFDTYRFQARPKEKRILLCSRLVHRKGFQTVLAAIQSLKLPGWQIEIVGDGPMYADLASLAKNSRVPVRMHGWIDNDSPKLADLYERAMIFALPSQQENCSIALLEAMSAGCAIITTDTSGNPELVGECGALVRSGDVAMLRNALADLTSNPAKCEELGRSAVKRARAYYDWGAISEQYISLLQRLTARKRAA